MTDKQPNPNRRDDLQADIDARFAKQKKTYTVEQVKRTNTEKITTVMTWVFISVLLGGVIFSAMQATGLI